MLIRRLGQWPSTGWDTPFSELERIRRQMDTLSEMFSGGSLADQFAGVFPLINLTEDNDNFYIRAELPGLKPDDLDISVTGDSFSISGERKIESDGDNVRYHRKEREAGKFSRVLNLPGQIDTDKVEANNVNGILTVTLPKSEVSRPRQITINAA